MQTDADLSPADRDDQLQMAVLGYLLLAYPAPFTLDEIVTAFEEPFGSNRRPPGCDAGRAYAEVGDEQASSRRS